MATTFKTFLNNDVTTTKTLLHEAIPITGAIVSGTYTQGDTATDASGKTGAEYNIKNYSHGMFQSVYDYPYLSSSANHIFDISVGYSTSSNLSGSTKQFASNGSSFGTISKTGTGLTLTQDVDNQFVSKVTVSTIADIGDGNHNITIVTPLGTSIITTSETDASSTTTTAVASGVAYTDAKFQDTGVASTTATNIAASLNAHAEIYAESDGAVVFIKFLSRAVNAHNDAFIGNLTQQEKKIAMYNQMAQVLMGHDKDGNIQRFDRDGNLSETTTDKMDEVIFLNFSRLLVKDEIKKGSFQLKLGTQPTFAAGKGLRGSMTDTTHIDLLTIKDTNAQNDFRINSPAGEYGILSASHSDKNATNNQSLVHGTSTDTVSDKVGLIFYQAGVVVLTASVFGGNAHNSFDRGFVGGGGILNQAVSMSIAGVHGEGFDKVNNKPTNASIDQMLTGSTISNIANNIRRRIYDISFNNTTELNSTVYFCRANHNEFNYSANPTYLNESKIRVKDVPSDMPISYVTSIGLYSPDNELMAVAKLSEPLRKDPTNELTLRVRLDY